MLLSLSFTIRMLVCINIEATVGAHVILFEPRFEALDMKVMLASKEEHFVAVRVCL